MQAAKCAAHRHLALPKHVEIACIGDELGFEVSATHGARKLQAGLYAHRDTPGPSSRERCTKLAFQLGDFSPGDESHLSSCVATSSLRAFLSRSSRSVPAGNFSAFSRRLMASSAKRWFRGNACLPRSGVSITVLLRRISAPGNSGFSVSH